MQTFRTTHNAWNALLGKLDDELRAWLTSIVHITQSFVTFTIDANHPNAAKLAAGLVNHGCPGKTGGFLNKVRSAALGEIVIVHEESDSATTLTPVDPIEQTTPVPVTVAPIAVPTPVVATPVPAAAALVTAPVEDAVEMESWRSVFGKLSAEIAKAK